MPSAALSLAEQMSADRQRLALDGFFQIMSHWQVDNSSARLILGSPAERTFYD